MAKKKSINLSELLKKYDVQDDINQYGNGGKMYGLGGDIGAGLAGAAKGISGSLLPGPVEDMVNKGIDNVHGAFDKDITDREKTIGNIGKFAGSAATAIINPASLPNAIPTMAEGVGGAISTGNPDSDAAQQIGAVTNLAGQFGGMAAGKSSMDNIPVETFQNGGMLNNKITEYNGNKHSQGGIQLKQGERPSVEVEGGEASYDNMVASDTLKYPGSEETFADKFKKLTAKYPRENDPYDAKGKEREAKAFFAIQERVKEEMGLTNSGQGDMQQAEAPQQFLNGGKTGLVNRTVTDMPFVDPRKKYNPDEGYMTEADYKAAANSTGRQPMPRMAETSMGTEEAIDDMADGAGIFEQDKPLFKKLNESNNKGITGGDAALFAAQNLGNLYNLKQGMSTPEEINLGRMDSTLTSDTAAIRNIQDAYARAKATSAGAIRSNTTSSGQTLSNRIAANTALTSKEAADIARIKEATENRNTAIQNQAQRTNLGIASQEEQLKAQTEGVRQNTLATALHGFSDSAARASRDSKMYAAQDRAIANLGTAGYSYNNGRIFNINTGEYTSPEEEIKLKTRYGII